MARTQVQAELIATNAISGTIIADNAITATHIATNSISGTLVQDGGIVTTMIAANNVTAAKIVSDGVETRHLHSNVISGQSTVTAASGDFVLIGDTSDSNNLKKALVSDFGETNRLPLAGGTMTGDLILGDGIRLELGAASGGDAQLFHSGSNAQFINTTGDTYIQNDNIVYITNEATSKNSAAFDTDGAVSLYYNNNLVFSTESGAARISSHGIGGNLNLFSDSGTNEGQFNITYLTDGSSAAHSVAEIRMQQGSGDGSARKGEMLFRVSNNGGPGTAMTIGSGGEVGIGTTSPARLLHLYANSSGDTAVMRIQDNGSHVAGIELFSGHGNWGIYNSDTIADTLEFRDESANALRMKILNDGEVVCGPSAISDTYAPLVNGITSDALVAGRHATSGSLGIWRTNTMEFKVYHNGQGYIMTWGSNGVISGDFNDTSDVNLKENISTIADGTTVINSLRPVKFDWKDAKKGNNQHGFIAQEVEKVLPDAVEGNDYVENETGLPEDEPTGNGKNMNSNAVLAHAVKAIQELEARIKVLEG